MPASAHCTCGELPVNEAKAPRSCCRRPPKQARVIPNHAGAAYNHGGITGSVEVLVVPAVRVEDLFVQADPQTGTILIQANVRNAAQMAVRGRVEFAVAPAAGGETLRAAVPERDLPLGDTPVETAVTIAQPRLWELNDPFLYRVTARVGDDEHSVRYGFRAFRFEDGLFRLNGRRIFLRSTHPRNHFPVGLKLPPDPNMAQRDLLDLKVMGFPARRILPSRGRAVGSPRAICLAQPRSPRGGETGRRDGVKHGIRDWARGDCVVRGVNLPG